MLSPAPFAHRLHGHAYTIGPRLLSRFRPVVPPPSVRWTRRIREGERELTLSGLLSERPDADTLAVILHGCGGAPDSLYAVRLAQFLFVQGVSVLRLAWRGADLAGEDLYHAAQTADLHAAFADPAFARYRRLWLVGFSLGGHASLHAAHESREPRFVAAATVCPVLHLMHTTTAIDAPRSAFYRRYLLAGLRAGYAQMHARGRAPTPLAEVERANTFRSYDALTVVPRYGFASVDDYYERACASRIVGRIERPTLVVVARHDPMLPAAVAEQLRPTFAPALELRWAERGGHCDFPRDLDLGEPGPLGVEAQLHAWLERHG